MVSVHTNVGVGIQVGKCTGNGICSIVFGVEVGFRVMQGIGLGIGLWLDLGLG